MIYTDGVHLIATCGTDELHLFAEKVGLKRECFQDHPRYPHYYILNTQIRKKASREGAKLVARKQLMRVAREANRNADKN